MAEEFKPDMQRALKKFPEMRTTRAMAMDRIDHMFKTNRTAALKGLNNLINKGSQSGGFNDKEEKIANKWYKSKFPDRLPKDVNERKRLVMEDARKKMDRVAQNKETAQVREKVSRMRANAQAKAGGGGMMTPDDVVRRGRRSLFKQE